MFCMKKCSKSTSLYFTKQVANKNLLNLNSMCLLRNETHNHEDFSIQVNWVFYKFSLDRVRKN